MTLKLTRIFIEKEHLSTRVKINSEYKIATQIF
jgi:hypothetical protein